MAGVLSRTSRPGVGPPSFRHRLTSPLPGLRGALELYRSLPPHHARTGAGVPVDPAAPHVTLPTAGEGDIAVTWLGHASALLRVDGVTVLVDPGSGAAASPASRSPTGGSRSR